MRETWIARRRCSTSEVVRDLVIVDSGESRCRFAKIAQSVESKARCVNLIVLRSKIGRGDGLGDGHVRRRKVRVNRVTESDEEVEILPGYVLDGRERSEL